MIRVLIFAATLCWSLLPSNLSAQETNSTDTEVASDQIDDFDDDFGEDFDEDDAPLPGDPLRGYNRLMFAFNDKAYYWVMKPVATGYGKVVPESARRAVHRCVVNLGFPVRFLNSALQLKLKAASVEFGRFAINTTIGIAGLFDPAAAHFGLAAPPREDLGQTLGHYGIGAGFPIVLPILGSSNLRDSLAMIPDWYVHPFSHLPPRNSTIIEAWVAENYLSLNLGEYDLMKNSAIDAYTMFKDGYKQRREAAIRE